MDTDTRARARANLSSMQSAYDVRIIRSNIFERSISVLWRGVWSSGSICFLFGDPAFQDKVKRWGNGTMIASDPARQGQQVDKHGAASVCQVPVAIPGQCRHGIVSDTGPEGHSIRSG
jgi:hypothetical protein